MSGEVVALKNRTASERVAYHEGVLFGLAAEDTKHLRELVEALREQALKDMEGD